MPTQSDTNTTPSQGFFGWLYDEATAAKTWVQQDILTPIAAGATDANNQVADLGNQIVGGVVGEVNGTVDTITSGAGSIVNNTAKDTLKIIPMWLWIVAGVAGVVWLVGPEVIIPAVRKGAKSVL